MSGNSSINSRRKKLNTIITESTRWKCKVVKEKEDGNTVYKIYEVADNLWVATFQDELTANAFAEEYPKLKEKYVKQTAETITTEQTVEKVMSKHTNNDKDLDTDLDKAIEEALKDVYK